MGRDCSSRNPAGEPAQYAHSMSWGTPAKVFSTSTASAPNSANCASDSEDRPSGLSAFKVFRSTTNASAVTSPPTTASPRPRLALTINSSRSPVTGFAVKTIPETFAGAIACTTTAMATSAWSMPISWR